MHRAIRATTFENVGRERRRESKLDLGNGGTPAERHRHGSYRPSTELLEYGACSMQAVDFQAPYEVAVVDKPEPELQAADDAIVRVDATGVCGSDLHIYHGRVQIEPGFIIGHEYVGTVEAVGDGVTSVAVGDRVLGCFQVACGTCWFCRHGNFHKCDGSRTFGHGATLGSLQGTQADKALVPHANLSLRRVPEGVSRDV